MSLRIEGDADTTVLNVSGIEPGIRIRGLSAEAAPGFLGQGPRIEAWAARKRRIVCEIAQPDGQAELTASPKAAKYTTSDGSVWLESDRAARVATDPSFSEPVFTGPRSLATAVAQQWARLGAVTLHAAAVQIQGVHILLLGRKGTGKSTACLSAIAAGGKVVSDDWLLAHLAQDKQPRIVSLRRKLLIRNGAAARTLLSKIPEVRTRRLSDRPKEILEEASRYSTPEMHGIDALLVLQRPRAARPTQSAIQACPPNQAFSAMISAATPLFYSRSYPHERCQLVTIASRMLSARSFHAVLGADLCADPAYFWVKLAGQIHRKKGRHFADPLASRP